METELIKSSPYTLLALILYIIVKDIIPLVIRQFPAYQKNKTKLQQEEISLRREMLEREQVLKKELADKTIEIERRSAEAIERIAENTDRLTELVSTNSMQTNLLTNNIAAMRNEQDKYFGEGREYMKTTRRKSKGS